MELYSNELLSDRQAEEMIDLNGVREVATAREKILLNFKVLIKVRESILKNPDKFDSLCRVLEDLEIADLPKKLKGITHATSIAILFTLRSKRPL